MLAPKMTDEQLIEALRKEVAAWFSNVHLLEFEELVRRYNMPYFIDDDGDTLNIRAIIHNRIELQELVEKLQLRLDGKEVNVTTPLKEEPTHG